MIQHEIITNFVKKAEIFDAEKSRFSITQIRFFMITSHAFDILLFSHEYFDSELFSDFWKKQKKSKFWEFDGR